MSINQILSIFILHYYARTIKKFKNESHDTFYIPAGKKICDSPLRLSLNETHKKVDKYALSHMPPTRPIVASLQRLGAIYMLGISKNQAEMPAQVLPGGMWLSRLNNFVLSNKKRLI